ncbi:two component transcriptional regulator, AraC family [Paenibacillaceae bacterium GAS479]|nr:two component transcriptional regulator, AraC family [Paenibacillaceae bacterium GAS479]
MIRVMLVEDEEVIRRGIASLIHQVSPHFKVVKEVSHGREALHYLNQNAIDAVITDIRIGEINGLQLLEKIREKFEDMPFLIISGYSDFTYAQKALQYGVSDYLLKPIDRKHLVCALDKIQAVLLKRSGKSTEPAEGEDVSEERQGPERRRLIRKIKEYIEAHPEGDLRLPTLADFVHMNPAYLSVLFKQETGINLSDQIATVRIERAKYLLSQTELKIYDIARLSGYQSPKHFMLVFKQLAGVTPSTFREQQTT